jgi:hypothetical protein
MYYTFATNDVAVLQLDEMHIAAWSIRSHIPLVLVRMQSHIDWIEFGQHIDTGAESLQYEKLIAEFASVFYRIPTERGWWDTPVTFCRGWIKHEQTKNSRFIRKRNTTIEANEWFVQQLAYSFIS